MTTWKLNHKRARDGKGRSVGHGDRFGDGRGVDGLLFPSTGEGTGYGTADGGPCYVDFHRLARGFEGRGSHKGGINYGDGSVVNSTDGNGCRNIIGDFHVEV